MFARLTACVLIAVGLAACASRPVNDRLAKVDPASGYRPYLLIPKIRNNDPQTLLILSFSGGGTRAAALSYGVLEELRRTRVVIDGQPRRLIDEVDLITGVSGGSFTALAYALYGEQLFAEYESRFLKRDVEGELIARALNPIDWPKFIGGSAGRSELAAEYYDEVLFDNATFGDLLKKGGPATVATATDLSTGAQFGFYQNDFDLLCSELSTFRLSRAAAASSAVPVVLSPVTLNNYGGTCDFKYPPWVAKLERDPTNATMARELRRYHDMRRLQDSKDRPYIHLVDGGIADNIGVRGVLETLEEIGGSAAFRQQVGADVVRRIVLVIVNSRSAPSTEWDKFESPPGFLIQLLQASSVPIENYSFDTVQMLQDRVSIMKWQRELDIANARLTGLSQAEAARKFPPVLLHVVDVAFDSIRDRTEREYFLNLPTSLSLNTDQVDRLRAIGGVLLQQSTAYRELLGELGATTAPAAD